MSVVEADKGRGCRGKTVKKAGKVYEKIYPEKKYVKYTDNIPELSYYYIAKGKDVTLSYSIEHKRHERSKPAGKIRHKTKNGGI